MGEPQRARLDAIDVVRGVIMVVMALDHTRDFFGVPGQSPTNLATASAALFLTRWITYFCAPVFFLLTGTGAFLSRARRSTSSLSRFLFTRGLWLVLLEVTLLRTVSYQFNVDYEVTMLLVIWALGASMIVLSGLVYLPVPVIAAFGIALIAGHGLLDEAPFAGPLWSLLHRPGFVVSTQDHVVFVAYPLVPWVGVTAVGYALGQVYGWEADRRRQFLLRVGLAMSVAFVVIRAIDRYGDPAPWTPQKSAAFTVLSFLSTTKYPPSLSFVLMTLGPALILLWAMDRATPRTFRPALVIGRVPLFYYALHFALIHLLAAIVCFSRYGSARFMFESPDLGHYPFSAPPGWGYSLPVVYVIWALVVVAMYPLCRWFAALKRRRSDWWLSYL